MGSENERISVKTISNLKLVGIVRVLNSVFVARKTLYWLKKV